MDQYTEITSDLYTSIGRFKTIYEAGNRSISNFFERIKIDEIQSKIKQAVQIEDNLSPLIYYLYDFYLEFKSINQINQKIFDDLNKKVSTLKEIYDALQQKLNDQTHYIIEITEKDNKIKQESEITILKLKQEFEQFKNDNQNNKIKQESEIQQLEQEIEQYKNDEQKDKRKISRLNQENKRLKNKVSQTKAKLEEENKNLQSQIDDVQNEINMIKNEKLQLEQKNTDLHQKFSDLESASNELYQKLNDISEENAKLLREVKNSMENEEKLKNLESEIDKLKKEKNNISQVPQEKTFEFLDGDSIKNFEKLESIESGSNSIVYKVAKKVIYALKELKLQTIDDEIQNFVLEYELMRILEHPNIVKTYGIYFGDEKNPPSIILEYCPLNLNCLFKNKPITNVELVFIIYQIVEGMKYVHFKKVIHLDLKPLNILISENNEIKISDFGISVMKENKDFLDKEEVEKVSFKFASPEILNGGNCNEKADVYSFGVILFFLLSRGQMPEMIPGQIANGIKAKIPDTFTEFSSKLISQCWNFDPKDRPSFEQIYNAIESNEFKLIDMNETEIKEVKKKINYHKERIPNY